MSAGAHPGRNVPLRDKQRPLSPVRYSFAWITCTRGRVCALFEVLIAGSRTAPALKAGTTESMVSRAHCDSTHLHENCEIHADIHLLECSHRNTGHSLQLETLLASLSGTFQRRSSCRFNRLQSEGVGPGKPANAQGDSGAGPCHGPAGAAKASPHDGRQRSRQFRSSHILCTQDCGSREGIGVLEEGLE